VLSAAQVAEFEACHGNLIGELGYDLAATIPDILRPMGANDWITRADERLMADVPIAMNVPLTADMQFNVEVDEARLTWPQVTQSPASTGTPPLGAAIWLSADGVTIRPMLSDQGTYRFVVPPGVQRLRLESRRVFPADRRAPYLGGTRSLGVRVSAIVIRSHTIEVVIPADDPRLIAGWYGVEQSGRRLWRWTDGSAELPWAGTGGPAVVTLRCQLPAVSWEQDAT
jgi:hypothetical protein